MMISSPRNRRGFTLVELLTVIAIISVLMGLTLVVISAVKEAARRAKAKHDMLNIVAAINAYYTEYGRFPVDAPDSSVDMTIANENDHVALFRVLMATGSDSLNPKKIVFITPPIAIESGTFARGGIDKKGVFRDPWGSPYQIRIDTNYDTQLANPYDSNAGPSTLAGSVVVWSLGKDGTGGNGDKRAGAGSDDVVSWQ